MSTVDKRYVARTPAPFGSESENQLSPPTPIPFNVESKDQPLASTSALSGQKSKDQPLAPVFPQPNQETANTTSLPHQRQSEVRAGSHSAFIARQGLGTRAVHGGNDVDAETRAIRRPITMANSYELPFDSTRLNWSAASGMVYTRNGGANQLWLEEKIAALEGAESCVVLASGVAAIAAVLLTFLRTGDHLVVSDNSYIATYRLAEELLPEKFGITSTLVDSRDLVAVRQALRPNTRLILIETPANPTLKISDIAGCARIAQGAGVLLAVDSTFASPYNQRPLELGADLSLQSLTKYINGHGDALGGAVSGSTDLIAKIKAEAMVNLGGAISPFNAWLIQRGSVTLALRMRQHNESGLRIAQWLKGRKEVSFVAYPGLSDSINHTVASQQMPGGFGGMLAFGLAANAERCNYFVSRLQLITNAVSLGHDESLIAYIGPNDERQHLYPPEFQAGFFRLSIGLEDAGDLLSDLTQALAASF
ncbi:MAG: aminotransferase class I/II-fold pyridoxal phosphate-dependent enzyme [Coriobacteriales bacterium]|jgi:methionine-gamma-lyase|nr:aminotransferase class I/II-fold pyridoxal phosphate-dependent enzyme [Coriobacteriales bacterium]